MTTGVPQVYIGSDERMGKAECALECSLRRNSTVGVEVHWMRSGDPGFDDWNIGRERGRPYSGGAWSTDFSCFRFAVPELAGFRGRAIYLDVDMLVLGDLRELWERACSKPWTCPSGRSEVSIIDCAAFRDRGWWPRLATMKASGDNLARYWDALLEHGGVDPTLPDEWNTLDSWTPETKLIHFSKMQSQPWKPWPEVLAYQRHRDPKAERLFWDYYHAGVVGNA